MKLNISIELNGSERHVGSIIGTGAYDARFCYSTDYIHDSDSIPVSVCLPLQAEPFSAEQTRNFFDELLPEGYLSAIPIMKRVLETGGIHNL